MLHINGNARDPRYESERFFAGHWLYFNGARVLSDIAAEEGISEIRVSDASLFRTATGRYRTSNEDIGLCALDKAGKPDWRVSEQVQLVSVDAAKNIIRVRRGCYGTKPLAFKTGKAYAAAHASEGPWGARSNILWLYNYSTRCPRNSKGRTCGDVFMEHLAELFGPGGELEAFDGLEFVIEGKEPVCISDITAHAHPDAMYRRFEKGLVLANPSPRPYTFEMKKLFANTTFRRLKATANQDTDTNNGNPIGESLTLEPKEGLFLIEHKNR